VNKFNVTRMKKYFINLAIRELKRKGHTVNEKLECESCGFKFEVNSGTVNVLPGGDFYFNMLDYNNGVVRYKFAGMQCKEMIVMGVIE